MDTTPSPKNETNAPDISDAELKMPEEQFGGAPEESHGSGMLIPLLVGTLVVLLAVLGALFFFGEELLEALNLSQLSPETDTAGETIATSTDTTEIDTIEAELEATDLTAIDTALEEIDAEIEASGTTTMETE